MAGNRGGARPGAGRKRNPYRNPEVAAKLINEARQRIGSDDMTKPLPLEWLLNVMWNELVPFDYRFKAAVAAAPMVHPRLASVQVSNPEDNRLVIEFKQFSGTKAARIEGPAEAVAEAANRLISPSRVAEGLALAELDESEGDEAE